MKTQQETSYPHTPTNPFENRLISLVRLAKQGKVKIDEVVREFYECDRVRRIARHVTREAGLESPVDEAVQLVADRFFTEGIMDTIYDEENLFSLIYRVAENAIRQEAESNLRWLRKHEHVHEDGPGIEEMQTVGDFSGDVLRKITRERSAAELMRRLGKQSKEDGMETYTLSSSIKKFEQDIARMAQESPPSLPIKVSRPAPKKEKILPPDAQELRDIRKKLSYGVKDMARSLNISRDKLSSALYGRLVPVPNAIMRDARDLLEASIAAISAREEKFKRFEDMNELVMFWLAELELDDNRRGEEELAVILGVFHSTLFRWRKAAYKPLISDLERYDLNVRNAVEHRKVIREAMDASGTLPPAKPVRRSTRKKVAAKQK